MGVEQVGWVGAPHPSTLSRAASQNEQTLRPQKRQGWRLQNWFNDWKNIRRCAIAKPQGSVKCPFLCRGGSDTGGVWGSSLQEQFPGLKKRLGNL